MNGRHWREWVARERGSVKLIQIGVDGELGGRGDPGRGRVVMRSLGQSMLRLVGCIRDAGISRESALSSTLGLEVSGKLGYTSSLSGFVVGLPLRELLGGGCSGGWGSGKVWN
jgi:hypothetical protein